MIAKLWRMALATGVALAGSGAWSAPDPAGEPPFAIQEIMKFEHPWAMAFLPDGRLLVTEKQGQLKLVDTAERTAESITGVPEVFRGGQGGLGDVVLHPQFLDNGLIYISYAEPGEGRGKDARGGAAVARAQLQFDARGGGRLADLQVIWRQVPKQTGHGHFGHRLAFGPGGKLWITSSERQKFEPAQDMSSNLGKIVRLNEDGSVPQDNPFADQGGVAAQVWSLGHRNMLGIAFDAAGRLWVHEMGPQGGDELNLIERGGNYGYPLVSNGVHYGGKPFPHRHDQKPEFVAPVINWTPVISPAGFVIYSGDRFSDWSGDGLIGGLSAQALVRVEFDGEHAREAARYDMGERIREVEQDADGNIWLLEDGQSDSAGRLLLLSPRPR